MDFIRMPSEIITNCSVAKKFWSFNGKIAPALVKISSKLEKVGLFQMLWHQNFKFFQKMDLIVLCSEWLNYN